MTYEIYRYIFLGGAILTGIMFVVSVLVFFLLKIPTVIGDLTGANARKAIEHIRNQNEYTGDKTSRISQVNRERGKLTDKISPSGTLIKNPSHSLFGATGTEKISTQRLHTENVTSETTVLPSASETTVLTGAMGASETTVLTGVMGASETTVLTGVMGASETTVLTGVMGAPETTVLNQGNYVSETTVLNAQTWNTEFVIEYEITYIHTDEVIA